MADENYFQFTSAYIIKAIGVKPYRFVNQIIDFNNSCNQL